MQHNSTTDDKRSVRRAGGFAARLCTAFLLLALLPGCQLAKTYFGTPEKKPLPGERLSILQLQRELTPSPALEGQSIDLPDAWENSFWPQVGGFPTHAVGHLALGRDLKRVWRISIGAGGDKRTPLIASPVVAQGVVYTLDTDGVVSAFDLEKGKRLWRQSVVPRGEEDSGSVGGGLAYDSGRLYLTSGYKYLIALNAQDGSTLWRAVTPAPGRTAPTVLDGRVYLITLDNTLSVYAVEDGNLLWKQTGVTETTSLLGSAAVAVDDSLVVLPLSSGELYGLRPENGRILWQDNLSALRRGGALSSISDIRGLPVLDGGTVYAGSYSGRFVAIDQVSGQRRWQREVGSAETPWVVGDIIFLLTSDQQLTALSRHDGAIYWVTQLPRFYKGKREKPLVWAGPVLAGGRLIAVGSGGEMMEVDPATGTIRKTHKLGDSATLAPVVSGKTLLVLTHNGTLSAYR